MNVGWPKQADVKVGDCLVVRRESFGRSGEVGEVTDVFKHGVSLDFYSSRCDEDDLTIEFWSWPELEVQE